MITCNSKEKADLVITNAHQVLTCADDAKDLVGLLQNTWIAVAGDKIIAVDSKDNIVNKVDCNEAIIIDASGKTVAPGFVDGHTHLVFGGSRVREYAARMVNDSPQYLASLGIPTGIMVSTRMTRETSGEGLFDSAKFRLSQMLKHGTTTVESKSGYGLSMTDEIKMLEVNQMLDQKQPIDIVSTFLGAHGWPDDMPRDKYIDLLVQEMIPLVSERKLAEYCDIWCDEGHYTAKESELILWTGEKYGLRAKIHTDAYSYIGGSDLACDMKMVSADHLNYTPVSLMPKLASANVVGVLLPAIEFAVKHPLPFNPRPMIEAGMTLALATNLCPGCYCVSLQFVMQLATRVYGFSVEQAIKAATLGGAKAINRDGDRGSIEVGKLADIQIWDVDTYEDVIYRIGCNVVDTVIKSGKVVVSN